MLVTHLTDTDLTLQGAAPAIVERLVAAGHTTADALSTAPAILGALVRQAGSTCLGLDCFWVLGALAMLGPILALGIRAFDQTGAGRSSGKRCH